MDMGMEMLDNTTIRTTLCTAPRLSQGMPACASTTNFPFLVSPKVPKGFDVFKHPYRDKQPINGMPEI